ncbi:hypothetical protein DU972_003978 [Vibrio mimicus]|nr:hypothetical protein [Vibrio cholerae]EGQ9647790.1 hypothetical protein [Vibrio cholerae]EHY8704832.1 hypothetical protein [Vibrio cholerae]EJL6640976.1 hypothetical protein [Vibrio cholerae]ELA7017050.1 hypothetical protein [Vibrio parahaemolyticus]
MSGLVLELQRDALNNRVDTSSLVRKALVVSKKLGIKDVENWLNQELNGYTDPENSLPIYRELHGALKVYNPMRGLIPFRIANPSLSHELSHRRIPQSIAELESTIKSNDSGKLIMNYPPEIRDRLMGVMELPMEPFLEISTSQIVAVIDSLRNEVLNWALELEQKGVKGEGMTFSHNEKQAAERVTYKITNNIGSMQNSQLQQASDNSHQSMDFEVNDSHVTEFVEILKSSIRQLHLNESDANELNAEVATIEHQLASPKPKKIILSESLKSVRNIIEGATGSIVATGLLAQLSVIMGNVS